MLSLEKIATLNFLARFFSKVIPVNMEVAYTRRVATLASLTKRVHSRKVLWVVVVESDPMKNGARRKKSENAVDAAEIISKLEKRALKIFVTLEWGHTMKSPFY